MQKMIEYMSFKAHYSNVGPKEEIPVNEMMDRLPLEILLELSVTILEPRLCFAEQC